MQTCRDRSILLRLAPLAGVVGVALSLAGCSDANRLETGYRYQRLGSTQIERRAYYADRFSEEAIRGESQSDRPIPRGRLNR